MQLLNKSRLIVYAAIILVVAILYVYVSTQRPLAPEIAESTFLYVQTAHSGSLVPTERDGIWSLTLNDVSPNTVFFSDRPNRETGHEPTENFILSWDEGENSFAVNPPNAALDIINDDGEQSVIIVELMSAAYDTDTSSLTYDVLILGSEPKDITAYESFAQSALFIDSTYKRYSCDCQIETGDTCTCRYSYTLGPSKTKEFQTVCKHTTYTDVGVADRKDTTTCTSHFMTKDFGGNYTSRTCTNWSATNKDEVTVKAICTENDPRTPGDD